MRQYYSNALLKKKLKYNIKEKVIPYRIKSNSLNTLIKVVIKLNNKFHK